MVVAGSIGVAIAPADAHEAVAVAREVEALGYASLWLPGGQGNPLPLAEAAVGGTERIRVATGIVPVDHVAAHEVAAGYVALERDAPGRFTVGLGGAHGPRPLATLGAYLDTLDGEEPLVPRSRRVLAALGPRMLALARDRAAGAYPFLITTEYTATAREILGPHASLSVLLSVVPETDPAAARTLAGAPLRFLGEVPGYVRSFARMGFDAQEVAGVEDRVVDAVTAWGDPAAIAARVAAYHAAGADEVVLRVTAPAGDSAAAWRERLAAVLL